MTRLDGHDRIEGDLRGGVIALGNFDGFHAGHQAVVGRAVHHAKDEGLPAIVATFDPHPVRFDTSKLVQVTQALIDEGFSDDEIRAVMGGNAIRVLRAGLVPLTTPSP